ncbi:uncharacterized protein F4807DRAFT_421652 [Annulohypoxylon truncatum]|uniref:uncharacterized protein n=1 Tax=Annulohypoxylon truncatum TaxID=327061 RepID=UPI002008A851|nr:uncharacterized protein F4807DRAFT_421652 [Annulohypoxylon truncatum]KAI1211100.1 hypothetical protein F4807DRAFT_421652 [Annulohypoxylon truncatum]
MLWCQSQLPFATLSLFVLEIPDIFSTLTSRRLFSTQQFSVKMFFKKIAITLVALIFGLTTAIPVSTGMILSPILFGVRTNKVATVECNPTADEPVADSPDGCDARRFF